MLAHIVNYCSLCGMKNIDDYIQDEIYLERLLISVNAQEQTRREIESFINELKP
jgi:hypothetical protein